MKKWWRRGRTDGLDGRTDGWMDDNTRHRLRHCGRRDGCVVKSFVVWCVVSLSLSSSLLDFEVECCCTHRLRPNHISFFILNGSACACVRACVRVVKVGRWVGGQWVRDWVTGPVASRSSVAMIVRHCCSKHRLTA